MAIIYVQDPVYGLEGPAMRDSQAPTVQHGMPQDNVLDFRLRRLIQVGIRRASVSEHRGAGFA